MSATTRPSKAQADYDLSCRIFSGSCVTVTLSGTTNRTAAALGRGVHRIVSDVNCCVLQGGSTVNATWETDHYLPAGEIDHFYVIGSTDTYVAAITNGDAGTLYITQAP